MASTGEARFLFFGSGAPLLSPQLVGNANISVAEFTAPLTSYFDGNVRPSFAAELTGDVVSQDNIQGSYTWENDFGRYILNYSSLYEVSSSLDKLTGIWTFSQASSGGALYTFTLTIDFDGTIFGSDTAGCVYNGEMTIIDSRYNIYRMSVEVSLCGEFGDVYDGLASFSETGLLGRSLMFGITSQEHSLSSIITSPAQP